jgi:hypothetical protein
MVERRIEEKFFMHTPETPSHAKEKLGRRVGILERNVRNAEGNARGGYLGESGY